MAATHAGEWRCWRTCRETRSPIAADASLPIVAPGGFAAGEIPEPELARAVAARHRLRWPSWRVVDLPALSLVPEKVARRYTVFPLRANDRQITVAVADPTDYELDQAFGFASGRVPVLEIAPPAAIERRSRISRPRPRGPTSGGEMSARRAGAGGVVEETGPEAVSSAGGGCRTPVVKLTNLILHEAVRIRASDIHLEPGREGAAVRFRVDGVMRTIMKLPSAVLSRVVPRIKIMAKLDIADRLRPQDGRARLKVDGATLDLRISTVPTRDAEKAVIRLLDPATRGSSRSMRVRPRTGPVPQALWLPRRHRRRHRSDRLRKDHSALRRAAGAGDRRHNIMTVEDPVEYELPGPHPDPGRVQARPDLCLRRSAPSSVRILTSSSSGRSAIGRPPKSRCRPA